jgi:hypothetical protein
MAIAPARHEREAARRVDVREVEPPGEQACERVLGDARWRAPFERADERDADRPGIEALCVGADDVPRDPAEPSLIDGSEAVDEEVVADVVPAVPLDVVELDRPDDRRRLGP